MKKNNYRDSDVKFSPNHKMTAAISMYCREVRRARLQSILKDLKNREEKYSINTSFMH